MFSTARLGLGLGVICCCTMGCNSQGAVHIQIGLPDDPTLSPLSRSLSRLTLVTEADGVVLESTPRDIPSSPSSKGPIRFGELGLHDGVELSLLGYTGSGRLVGFGRVPEPIAVTASGALDLTIPLRRPYAYVSGGPRLIAADTTVEPGEAFFASIDGVDVPLAAAATPNGATIVAVAAEGIVQLSTSRHTRTTAPVIALEPGASGVAISPDSRWAVVTHPAGVSLVDLAARAGTAQFVPIEHPGTVVVGRTTAWVLSNPSNDCAKASALVPIALASAAPGEPIVLAGAARDLALGPNDSTVLVAEPCQDAVFSVSATSQVVRLRLSHPTRVAVIGNRVWAVGSETHTNAQLVIASAGLDGAAAASVPLQLTQELAQSNDLTEAGQTAEVRLAADSVDAYGLSILPHGGSAVLLVHANYHADEVVRRIEVRGVQTDETIVPALDMETYEYQLVDVATGVATQRLRTSWAIHWKKGDAILDDWSCAHAEGQQTTATDFVAHQVTVLFGAK